MCVASLSVYKMSHKLAIVPVGTPDWVDVGSVVVVIKVGTVDRISIVEVGEKPVRSTQCICIQLL